MTIYATPCNKKYECAFGSDEAGCNNNSITNIVLGFLTITVVLLFIGLRYNKVNRYLNQNQELTSTEIFRTYEWMNNAENENEESINLVNLHLLHSMKTNSVEENHDICVRFYNLEAKLNNYKESEIYLSLHRKLDPAIAKNVVDEKFPGCLDGFKNCIEKISRKQWIRGLTDWINRTEWVKRLISNTKALTKIEFKFIDLYKDLGLSFLMLKLVGGPQAIIDNPTNFSSVIVMLMFSSIFVPILVSSLHLVVNNSQLLMRFISRGSSNLRRILITAVLVLLSPFHPVLLECLYLETSEEARTMTQSYNLAAIDLIRECRRIQIQNANFFKIELGMLIHIHKSFLSHMYIF